MSSDFRTMLHSNSLLEVQMIRAVFETHGVRMQIVEHDDSYEIRVLEDTFDRAAGILSERGILGGEGDDDVTDEEDEPEVEFHSDGVALPVPEGSYDARINSPTWIQRAWNRIWSRWNR